MASLHHTPASNFPLGNCSICLVDLASKRSMALSPCGHLFHWSCCTQWMESRETPDDQTCPNCRTLATFNPPLFPYGGTGQPTEDLLRDYSQPLQLRSLLRDTQSGLQLIATVLQRAVDEGRSIDYIKDIREEMKRLRKRRTKIEDLLATVRRRNMPIYLQERERADEDDYSSLDAAIHRAKEGRGLRWAILVQHTFLPTSSATAELMQIMDQGAGAVVQHQSTVEAMWRGFDTTRAIVSQIQSPLLTDETALSIFRFLSRWNRTVWTPSSTVAIDIEYDPSVVIVDIGYEAGDDGGVERSVNGRIID